MCCVDLRYLTVLICTVGHFLALTQGSRSLKTRKIQIVETPCGNFEIVSTSRKHLVSSTACSDECAVSQPSTEVIITVKTVPNEQALQAVLTTYFHQRIDFDGYHYLHPSISVGIRLPKTHPVFSVMKNGDLAGLLRMLDQGEASLRTYDEEGRPLIGVIKPQITFMAP